MKTLRSITTLILFTLLPAVAWADNLYVVENTGNVVDKYTTTGSLVTGALISGLNNPRDLKLDGQGNMFLASSPSGVAMYTTAGVALNRSLVTVSGYDFTFGVAVWGTNLVTSVVNSASVPSYMLSGSNVVSSNSQFISALTQYSEAIVTDGSYFYLTDILLGHLQKFTMTGALVNYNLAVGSPNAYSMAIDGTNLYVAYFTSNYIAHYSTTGAVLSTNLIPGIQNPYGIAADGKGHLFVANYNGGTVGEYGTDGSVINSNLITNLHGPCSLAIEITAPSLNISQSTNGVAVSWIGSTNYFLQTNANLTSTNWNVDPTVTSTNGSNTAIFNLPVGSLFFRLESTNGL